MGRVHIILHENPGNDEIVVTKHIIYDEMLLVMSYVIYERRTWNRCCCFQRKQDFVVSVKEYSIWIIQYYDYHILTICSHIVVKTLKSPFKKRKSTFKPTLVMHLCTWALHLQSHWVCCCVSPILCWWPAEEPWNREWKPRRRENAAQDPRSSAVFVGSPWQPLDFCRYKMGIELKWLSALFLEYRPIWTQINMFAINREDLVTFNRSLIVNAYCKKIYSA